MIKGNVYYSLNIVLKSITSALLVSIAQRMVWLRDTTDWDDKQIPIHPWPWYIAPSDSMAHQLHSFSRHEFKQCGKILSSKHSTIYELVTNEHRVTTIVNNPGPNDNKNQLEYENRMRKSRRELCMFEKERSFDPNRSKGNVSEERPTLAAALWAINSKKELRRETEAPTTMDAQRAKALLIIPVRRRYALNERVDVVRHWGPCKGMPMHCLTPSRSGDVGSGIAKRFVLLSRE
uniref:Uncharacterized protein n=1 Tax=Vespula pensylvanica TaxID=30213 RepID=A0A834NS27_VESPE|nr:hypothetical protein H0235_011479 [Vespula pensylvanica]